MHDCFTHKLCHHGELQQCVVDSSHLWTNQTHSCAWFMFWKSSLKSSLLSGGVGILDALQCAVTCLTSLLGYFFNLLFNWMWGSYEKHYQIANPNVNWKLYAVCKYVIIILLGIIRLSQWAMSGHVFIHLVTMPNSIILYGSVVYLDISEVYVVDTRP